MLTLGLFTDVHYAAGVREGTRHCHLGVAKLRVALGAFAAARVDAVVGLGDLVDSADTLAEEAGYLQSVCAQLSGVRVPVRLTPGNHCLWTLTRDVYQQITRTGHGSGRDMGLSGSQGVASDLPGRLLSGRWRPLWRAEQRLDRCAGQR